MSWDRERIIDIIVRAGGVARGLKKELRHELKADQSLVTQADREVEELITGELEDTGSGIYLIGEETVAQKGEDYIASAFREEAYIVDPVDGTSPFAHGMPNWGVSIGRMEAGVLRDGAVFLPDFGEIVMNDGEDVLEGVLEEGRWSWRKLEPAPRETGSSRLIGITQRLAKRGKARVRNPVQVLGAAVVPLVGLLQGRFGGYLGSVKLWDVAGALPNLLRHGFSITVREGDEIRRVTAEVNDHVYHLRPESRRRWSFRSDLLVCRSEDEERLRESFTEEG